VPVERQLASKGSPAAVPLPNLVREVKMATGTMPVVYNTTPSCYYYYHYYYHFYR
jgi:hypothetical protein